jgi:hypothetical protein
MYPWDMARRKVEMGGEPNERWWYATKRASGRELRENRAVGDGEGDSEKGAEKNQRSEEGDLVPERKEMGEVGVSKMVTEVRGENSNTVWTDERGDAQERMG